MPLYVPVQEQKQMNWHFKMTLCAVSTMMLHHWMPLDKAKTCIAVLAMVAWQKQLLNIWKSVSFWYSNVFNCSNLFSASKMWQHEIDDWNMTGCVDGSCSEANNCDGGADGQAPFGCGHFTQQIWKTTTHMCYQVIGFHFSFGFLLFLIKKNMKLLWELVFNPIKVFKGTR